MSNHPSVRSFYNLYPCPDAPPLSLSLLHSSQSKSSTFIYGPNPFIPDDTDVLLWRFALFMLPRIAVRHQLGHGLSAGQERTRLGVAYVKHRAVCRVTVRVMTSREETIDAADDRMTPNLKTRSIAPRRSQESEFDLPLIKTLRERLVLLETISTRCLLQ